MLTIKQKILLEAIEWFINEHGYSPTLQELAELTKTAKATVFAKLMELEKKKYISTVNGKARTIRVLRGVEE